MVRERFHPDGKYPKNDAPVVTTEGSGFGPMAIVAGIESEFFLGIQHRVISMKRIVDYIR